MSLRMGNIYYYLLKSIFSGKKIRIAIFNGVCEKTFLAILCINSNGKAGYGRLRQKDEKIEGSLGYVVG